MNDPSRPSLLERLSAMLLREPEDREQLLELLRSAHQRDLLDADALSIIEGALTVSEMQVRDIMIPRAQMDVIDINEPVESFIPQLISAAHSRFPVIDQNRDDVIGILLAKDLLRHVPCILLIVEESPAQPYKSLLVSVDQFPEYFLVHVPESLN